MTTFCFDYKSRCLCCILPTLSVAFGCAALPFITSKFSRLWCVMPATPPLWGIPSASGKWVPGKAVSAGPGVTQSSLIHQHGRAAHADVLLVLPLHLRECSIYGSITLLLVPWLEGMSFSWLTFCSGQRKARCVPNLNTVTDFKSYFFVHCVFFLQNSWWLHKAWRTVAQGAWFDIML